MDLLDSTLAISSSRSCSRSRCTRPRCTVTWHATSATFHRPPRRGASRSQPAGSHRPGGTILVPAGILALSLLAGGGGIPSAAFKPVPVNPRACNPKSDMLRVAAAGPFVQLRHGDSRASAVSASASPASRAPATLPVLEMADAGIRINAVLMALNLLPIPPLDGGRIAVSLLPNRLAWQYARLEPYGFPILLVLLFTGVLGTLLWPLLTGFRYLHVPVFDSDAPCTLNVFFRHAPQWAAPSRPLPRRACRTGVKLQEEFLPVLSSPTGMRSPRTTTPLR